MKRALLVAVCALAACAGAAKEPQKVSLNFQAQLDSGNAAYRRGDYKASSKWFHAAAQSDSANLSGWYGIYMAESKLGNTAEAARAKAIVAKEAPYMPLTEHPTAASHLQQQQEQQKVQNPHGQP